MEEGVLGGGGWQGGGGRGAGPAGPSSISAAKKGAGRGARGSLGTKAVWRMRAEPSRARQRSWKKTCAA